MSLLASYYLPGLAVEDHAIDVPLRWQGTTPAELAASGEIGPEREKLHLFYRTLCLPQNVGKPMPLLVYLQGGPGGAGPRVTDTTSDGWVEEAVKHFRVVLPDQRGTGRSSRVDGRVMARLAAEADAKGVDAAHHQAAYLKRFLAGSIVRDFEYLRLVEFGGQPWVTLGQSYGGFLTLAYLSAFPEGVVASFVAGGIPHVPANASEVYAHTFPRMAAKTRAWYERYPGDEQRVALVADRLAAGDVRLPDGSPLSVRRLQLVGQGLGMKPWPERMHNLFDLAFCDGDGSVQAALSAAYGNRQQVALSDGFIHQVMELTSTPANPLYWTLQEFIYADGKLEEPVGWAAAGEAARHPEFSQDARPLMFFGEAVFPWMFSEDSALVPFKAAVEVLMSDVYFERVYDQRRLAANMVPLYAAVYHDDAYVDSGLQLDTLSRVGSSHAWVTNEFEHDGLHGTKVFKHLFDEARGRGELAGIA